MKLSAATRVDLLSQLVRFDCECGQTRQAYLNRYQVVRCGVCGKFWWALQPFRNGNLAAYPWPGLGKREEGASV